MNLRARQGGGQTLPLFASVLPGLLALMALGLDGAQIFLERRDAQGAADLAAVAGAKQLPASKANANVDAELVGQANGYTAAEVIPNADYGTESQIEVVIDTSVTPFFMPILNFFAPGDYTNVDVSARAVAQSNPGASSSGDYAIFTLQTCGSKEDFKSLEWQGNLNDVTGSVHSSAGADLSGNSNTISGEFTIECHTSDLEDTGKDPYTDSGSNPALAGTTGDPADCDGSEVAGEVCNLDVTPPPVPSRSDFGCDFNLSDGDDVSGTITSGVYCVNGKLSVKDDTKTSPVSAGATFVADEIILEGDNVDLRPYSGLTGIVENALMFADKVDRESEVIDASGNNGTYEGFFYAPDGVIKWQGNGNHVTGAFIGWAVEWSGENNDLVGTGGIVAGGPPTIAIIE